MPELRSEGSGEIFLPKGQPVWSPCEGTQGGQGGQGAAPRGEPGMDEAGEVWGAPEYTHPWRPNEEFCVRSKGNGEPKEGLSKTGYVHIILVAGGGQTEGHQVNVGKHIIQEVFIKLH